MMRSAAGRKKMRTMPVGESVSVTGNYLSKSVDLQSIMGSIIGMTILYMVLNILAVSMNTWVTFDYTISGGDDVTVYKNPTEMITGKYLYIPEAPESVSFSVRAVGDIAVGTSTSNSKLDMWLSSGDCSTGNRLYSMDVPYTGSETHEFDLNYVSQGVPVRSQPLRIALCAESRQVSVSVQNVIVSVKITDNWIPRFVTNTEQYVYGSISMSVLSIVLCVLSVYYPSSKVLFMYSFYMSVLSLIIQCVMIIGMFSLDDTDTKEILRSIIKSGVQYGSSSLIMLTSTCLPVVILATHIVYIIKMQKLVFKK